MVKSYFFVKGTLLGRTELWRQQRREKTAYVGGRNGDVLFSRGAAPRVSSELKSLTSVFGMGTGVPSSL